MFEPYDGPEMLPEPAFGRKVHVCIDWDSGHTQCTVKNVGTFTLIPVLDCPEGWSDPHGRAVPCNHVAVYMGTGGPHTRPENRKDVPVVYGHALAGPVLARAKHGPPGLEAGSRRVYLSWQTLPNKEEAGRIVNAVAAHWSARQDVEHIKAAYARAQAPRLLRKARTVTGKVRRRFDKAAQELAQAIADENHQQEMADTGDLTRAAHLIGPEAPIWSEYAVYGNRNYFSDEFLLSAVVDVARTKVDNNEGTHDWQPQGMAVTATSPEEAVNQVIRQIEGETEGDGA